VPFSAVATILKNQCAGCHYHSSWAGVSDPAQLKQAKWVVPGQPEASGLYMRLIGSEGSGSNFSKDMPQGGSAISPADRALIKRWIQELK
jgi:hypothetical protein